MTPQDPNIASLDLTAIAERLRTAIAAELISGKDFAERCGVPYSTMRTYLDRGRAPSSELLAAMYRTFGVMPHWVLTGDEPMRRNTPAGKPEVTASEFVTVPLLPIKASAGNGAVNEAPASYEVAGMCFRREWLLRRHLNPAALAVITVRGASMAGVLADGDQVLIDQSDTHPRSGYVYVIRQGDELLVKFCQLLPGGLLRVSSANTQFAAYDVDLNKTPDVQIVGRVVASMHEW
jgi:phage repressor protein C with HTH and peptisase S24 domain